MGVPTLGSQDRDAFARWDTLPLQYPSVHTSTTPGTTGGRAEHAVGTRARAESGSASDAAWRCIARIEPFELAARAAAAGVLHPHDSVRLAESYTQRIAAWSGPAAPPPQRASTAAALLLLAAGCVGPLSLLAAQIGQTRQGGVDPAASLHRAVLMGLLSLPLLAPLAVLVVVHLSRLALPRLSLAQALQQRACPDCAAHLESAADAIDPALIGGVRTGPRACTRCRRPWPLLPPPPTFTALHTPARTEGVIA